MSSPQGPKDGCSMQSRASRKRQTRTSLCDSTSAAIATCARHRSGGSGDVAMAKVDSTTIILCENVILSLKTTKELDTSHLRTVGLQLLGLLPLCRHLLKFQSEKSHNTHSADSIANYYDRFGVYSSFSQAPLSSQADPATLE